MPQQLHVCAVLFHYMSPLHTYPRAVCVFFLMIRRPPRSTLDRSSAASDVYKRQLIERSGHGTAAQQRGCEADPLLVGEAGDLDRERPVSYTHLRAHETVLDLVCRLLLEKKKCLLTPT